MWQILLGIYIIVTLLIFVVLWSSLVVAKRSDQQNKVSMQQKLEFTIDEVNSLGKRSIQFAKLRELSEK